MRENKFFFEKKRPNICRIKKKPYLCIAIEKQTNSTEGSLKDAQMAELVDALVSNTNGFTSMPVRSRLWVRWTTED